MSDEMLHSVLCMPPEAWGDGEIDVNQRHQRYLEASQRIKLDAIEMERLRAAVLVGGNALGRSDNLLRKAIVLNNSDNIEKS